MDKYDLIVESSYRDMLKGPYKDLSYGELRKLAIERQVDQKIIDQAERAAKGRGGPCAVMDLVNALNDLDNLE